MRIRIRYVDKQERVRTAAVRFRASYSSDGKWHSWVPGDHEATYQALLDAKTPEDVVALLNASWLSISCDACERDVEPAVELRSHSEDEYGPCTYCRECLSKALALFPE